MADIPGVANDLFGITVTSIRKSIQGRTQGEDIFGRPRKTPSYEELRKREEGMLKGINGTSTALDASADWRSKGPERPEFNKPDNQFTDRGLVIYDLETTENITIQFVPQELDYDPQSDFVAIASMARNNPLYHYTGSEDTLRFSLDWYSQEDSREDVLFNCKKLEALTKNDSFDRPPHRVKLIWGKNNIMFSDATWLVVSAPYKLSMFQAHKSMLPQQAYQTVTLKRVSEDNPSVVRIRSMNH